jgi:predicted nuclease of predicted toxin-antitoxin system
MKLLVDMNLSPRWVSLLADAGIEAAHWSTIGSAKAPDSEIMSYASANGYVVLTHDLDFSAILAATHGEKPSVVQIRSDDLGLDTIGKPVVSAIRQMESELEEGALLTVRAR